MAWKSSLPAIRKITVLMVDSRVKPRARRLADLLHRIDLRAHDAGTPVLDHGAHHVDLLAIEDLAQPLLVDPGPRGAYRGQLGDQGVEVGRRLRLEAGSVLQQRPAHALEGLVGALLDAAHLVHRRAGMPDDVELVERDAAEAGGRVTKISLLPLSTTFRGRDSLGAPAPQTRPDRMQSLPDFS
jgi:hypothetical protein